MRSILGRLLSWVCHAHLLLDPLDVYIPGKPFPKCKDPVAYIEKKKWPVKIVQKPGSLLDAGDILPGHRDITDAIVRRWSKDIENGLFILESIDIDTNAQIQQSQPNTMDRRHTESHTTEVSSKKRKRKNRTPKRSHNAEKGPRYNKKSSNISHSKKSEYVARLKALAKIKDSRSEVRSQAGPSSQDDGSDFEKSETEPSETEHSDTVEPNQ